MCPPSFSLSFWWKWECNYNLLNINCANIRIDANRKKEFEEFCEAVGLTMTAAFNIFIQRTLRDYRIPFDIGAEMPNAETKEAIKEVQRMKSDPVRGKTYTDVDTMMKDILG